MTAVTQQASAPPRRPTSFVGRLRWRFRPPEPERRRRLVAKRLNAIAAEPAGRLLVVQAHALQRIDTPAGPRFINPYLGPVLDRLRGGRLDPFEVDLRATMADPDAKWASARVRRPLAQPPDRRRRHARGQDDAARSSRATRRAPAPTGSSPAAAALEVSGVDLGPSLARIVADRVAGSLGRRIVDVDRIRALLRRTHADGILLADEYHRQDWLAAAAAEGVPVAAVQHGVISPLHTGYVHRTRPPELRLPGRTYVFGPWERDVLTRTSVYRPEEVVVGGSPRLDLVGTDAGTAAEPGRRPPARSWASRRATG